MTHPQALQSLLHLFFGGLGVLQSPEAICFQDMAFLVKLGLAHTFCFLSALGGDWPLGN